MAAQKSYRFYIILFIICLVYHNNLFSSIRILNYGSFKVEHDLVLPGSCEVIFDAITGDISKWWDHSFSKSPKRFYIDPVPGGGFYEIFNNEGQGVLHATVIYADRGKLLRFDGPLGLSGKALKMVHTYKFDPVHNDSTHLKVSVHAAGELEDGLADTIDKVWYHFLFERFKPYIEAGDHLKK